MVLSNKIIRAKKIINTDIMSIDIQTSIKDNEKLSINHRLFEIIQSPVCEDMERIKKYSKNLSTVILMSFLTIMVLSSISITPVNGEIDENNIKKGMK